MRIRKDIGKNTEGSFRLKKNGRVEYRISYRKEFDQLAYKSFSGADKKECIARADEFMEKEEKRRAGIDVDATIPDIVHGKYLSDYQKNYVGEQGYCRNIGTLRIVEKAY